MVNIAWFISSLCEGLIYVIHLTESTSQ